MLPTFRSLLASTLIFVLLLQPLQVVAQEVVLPETSETNTIETAEPAPEETPAQEVEEPAVEESTGDESQEGKTISEENVEEVQEEEVTSELSIESETEAEEQAPSTAETDQSVEETPMEAEEPLSEDIHTLEPENSSREDLTNTAQELLPSTSSTHTEETNNESTEPFNTSSTFTFPLLPDELELLPADFESLDSAEQKKYYDDMIEQKLLKGRFEQAKEKKRTNTQNDQEPSLLQKLLSDQSTFTAQELNPQPQRIATVTSNGKSFLDLNNKKIYYPNILQALEAQLGIALQSNYATYPLEDHLLVLVKEASSGISHFLDYDLRTRSIVTNDTLRCSNQNSILFLAILDVTPDTNRVLIKTTGSCPSILSEYPFDDKNLDDYIVFDRLEKRYISLPAPSKHSFSGISKNYLSYLFFENNNTLVATGFVDYANYIYGIGYTRYDLGAGTFEEVNSVRSYGATASEYIFNSERNAIIVTGHSEKNVNDNRLISIDLTNDQISILELPVFGPAKISTEARIVGDTLIVDIYERDFSPVFDRKKNTVDTLLLKTSLDFQQRTTIRNDLNAIPFFHFPINDSKSLYSYRYAGNSGFRVNELIYNPNNPTQQTTYYIPPNVFYDFNFRGRSFTNSFFLPRSILAPSNEDLELTESRIVSSCNGNEVIRGQEIGLSLTVKNKGNVTSNESTVLPSFFYQLPNRFFQRINRDDIDAVSFTSLAPGEILTQCKVYSPQQEFFQGESLVTVDKISTRDIDHLVGSPQLSDVYFNGGETSYEKSPEFFPTKVKKNQTLDLNLVFFPTNIRTIKIQNLWDGPPSEPLVDGIRFQKIRIPEFLPAGIQSLSYKAVDDAGNVLEGTLSLEIEGTTAPPNLQLDTARLGCPFVNQVDTGSNVDLNFTVRNSGGDQGNTAADFKVELALCDSVNCANAAKKKVLKTYTIPKLTADQVSTAVQESVSVGSLPTWYSNDRKGYLVLKLDSANQVTESFVGEQDNITNKAVTRDPGTGDAISCEDTNQQVLTSFNPSFTEDFSSQKGFAVATNAETPITAASSSDMTSHNLFASLTTLPLVSYALDFPKKADLEGLEETELTPEIIQLAEELNHDPNKISDFLTNSIFYEPYYGSRKGAQGCLTEGRCNDYDSASLGIALMRASDIPARYEEALVDIDAQLMVKALGVENAKVAYAMLHEGLKPYQQLDLVMKAGASVPSLSSTVAAFDQVQAFRMSFVYFKAFLDYDARSGAKETSRLDGWREVPDDEKLQEFIGTYFQRRWIPIMSLQKNQQVTVLNSQLHSPDALPSAVEGSQLLIDTYIQNFQEKSPVETFTSQSGLSESIVETTSTPINYGILPEVLPVLKKRVDAQFSTVPEHKKVKTLLRLRKEAEGALASYTSVSSDTIAFSATLPVSQLNSKNISLSYRGFSSSDEQTLEQSGGLFNVTTDQVTLKPILTIDGEEVSSSATLSQGLEPGSWYVLDTVVTVGNTLITWDKKYSMIGADEGLALNFGRASAHSLEDDAIQLGLPGLAHEYWHKVESDLDELARVTGARYRFDLSRSVVSNKLYPRVQPDGKVKLDFIGLQTDSSYLLSNQQLFGEPSEGQVNFRRLAMLTASYHEHQAIQTETNLESISTIRALQYAYSNPDDYTVYTITKDTAYQLDLVDLPTRTKEMMRADIEAGNTVITPNKKVRIFSWEDSVYLSYNPLTGEGRYVLGEGVLNGGDTPCAADIKKALFDPRLPDEVPICLANGKDSVRVSYKVERDANGKISFVGFVFTSQANGQQKIGNITDSNLDNWLLEVEKYKEATGSENCPEFGYPVRDKIDYNYGRYQHTAWEFSNGFKAFSPDVRGQGFTPLFSNYNTVINKTKAEQSFKSLGFLSGSKKLEFSPSIGTYKAFQGGLKTAYLVPKSTGTTADYSKVVTIENELLSRADTEVLGIGAILNDQRENKENLLSTYYQNGLGSTYCRTRFSSDANCRKTISILGFPIENLSAPSRVSSFTEQISTLNQDIQKQNHIGGTSFIHKSTRDFGSGSITPISTVYRHSYSGIRDAFFDQGSISSNHSLLLPTSDTIVASSGVLRQNFANNQAVLFTINTNSTQIIQADELRKSGYSCNIQPLVSDFELLKAFVNGVTDTGVSELEGTAELITDPFGTIQALKTLISSPFHTIQGVSQLLIDQYNGAACPGRKSYLAGQITAFAGTAILGAKGATKVSSAVKATRAGVWIERIAQIKKGITAGLKTRVTDYAQLLTRKTASFWEDLYNKRLETKIASIDLENPLDDYKVYQLTLETEEEILKEVLEETGENAAKIFRNISFINLYNEAGALLAQAKAKGLKIFQIADTSGNQRLTDYLAKRAVESGENIYTKTLNDLKSDTGKLDEFLTNLQKDKMSARKKFFESQNYNTPIGVVDSKAKTAESLLEKMENEPEKFFNLGQVKDLERHRIVVNEMKDIEKVYDKVEEIYGGNILEVKPKYQKGIEFDGNPSFEAKQYRVNESIQMVIKDENGDIFELQIKTKRSHDSGEFEHLEVYKKPESTENFKEVGAVKAYMDAYIKDLRNYVLSN